MTQQDKDLILDLFYERIFSLDQIQAYFNDKYTERDIKAVVRGVYKDNSYGKTSNNRRKA